MGGGVGGLVLGIPSGDWWVVWPSARLRAEGHAEGAGCTNTAVVAVASWQRAGLAVAVTEQWGEVPDKCQQTADRDQEQREQRNTPVISPAFAFGCFFSVFELNSLAFFGQLLDCFGVLGLKLFEFFGLLFGFLGVLGIALFGFLGVLGIALGIALGRICLALGNGDLDLGDLLALPIYLGVHLGEQLALPVYLGLQLALLASS